LGFYIGFIISVIFIIMSVIQDDIFSRSVGIILGLLWLSAPLVVKWLNQPLNVEDELTFTELETVKLQQLARDIWSFFEVYVTEDDHHLPPDNVQLDPNKGIAHRTSPTN